MWSLNVCHINSTRKLTVQPQLNKTDDHVIRTCHQLRWHCSSCRTLSPPHQFLRMRVLQEQCSWAAPVVPAPPCAVSRGAPPYGAASPSPPPPAPDAPSQPLSASSSPPPSAPAPPAPGATQDVTDASSGPERTLHRPVKGHKYTSTTICQETFCIKNV